MSQSNTYCGNNKLATFVVVVLFFILIILKLLSISTMSMVFGALLFTFLMFLPGKHDVYSIAISTIAFLAAAHSFALIV